jgi:hypothetical protein
MIKSAFVTGVLGFVVTAQLSSQPQSVGRFVGDVVTRWDTTSNKMTLVKDFTYVDPAGVTWDAPEGWQIDGASIPRIAWTVVGDPYSGPYRFASVIHDVACDRKTKPWKDVHRAFYMAMLAGRVSQVQAKIMYAAVYHFGPRWAERVGRVTTPPEPYKLTQADFKQLSKAIAMSHVNNEPSALPSRPGMSLEQIEDFDPRKNQAR